VVVTAGLQDRRDRVLLAAYEMTGGDSLQSVVAREVAVETGLPQEAVEPAVRALVARDLLTFSSLAGDFTLTPLGVDEAERLLADDVDLTTVVLTLVEQRTLEAFTREVREALELASLEPEARADAEAQLATIEAQQRSPKPRRAVIGFALRALGSAAESVVGGILGNSAYDLIRALMT
jgi:DNA-binding MarR family transcriptional regulator